jgi:HAD superfamily hydrolase (TIGR01484 family)
MSKIRAIVFDIDGTAVISKRDAMPSSRLVAAIKAAKEHIHLLAASGRHSSGPPVIKALGLTDPCVLGGGTIIVDPVSGRVISQSILSPEAVTHIQAAVKSFPYDVYLPSARDGKRQTTGSHPEKTKYPYVGIPDVSAKYLTPLMQALSHIPGITASPSPDWDGGHYIQITNSDATKEHGIRQVLSGFNIDKAETIGVGDADNDIHLFAAVGHRIAMENATDQLKSIADEIAPSIDEDGLAWVIEHYASAKIES